MTTLKHPRRPSSSPSARPRPRELTAGEYVHTLLTRAARRRRRRPDDRGGAHRDHLHRHSRPACRRPMSRSVIGPAPIDRVLYDVFRGRPLPGVGLAVQKPTWTTMPNGAWAATVDADATTGNAVIGLNAASVERWDWATALSYTAAKRSSPDAITTIYGAAVENFYIDVETKIATLLDTTAGTPNAAIKIGAGIGAFYTRCGRAPEVIIVAPDVWGLLADAGALTLPRAPARLGHRRRGRPPLELRRRSRRRLGRARGRYEVPRHAARARRPHHRAGPAHRQRDRRPERRARRRRRGSVRRRRRARGDGARRRRAGLASRRQSSSSTRKQLLALS